MSKQTRQEKKREEQRIIAELEAALAEAREQTPDQTTPEPPQEKPRGRYGNDPTPAVLHCKRCKTQLQNGVCPTCGYKVYVPMDEKKRKRIRYIVAGVCIAVFLVIFLLLRL